MPRALIVDDFATMRRILGGRLGELGFDVVQASDGAEALAQLRDSTFDVLVTDIGMPGMNGFELLQAVRKDDRWRRLPVLLITAEARPEETVRSVREGANGYLVKPFSKETLEAKLRRAAPACFAREPAKAPAASEVSP